MVDGNEQPHRGDRTDWCAVIERAVSGDPAAYAQLTRLVTQHLGRWRAFDFRPDWDDMTQDVLISVVGAYGEGRLAAPGAVTAYLRQATRYRFIDRLRAGQREAPDADAEEAADEARAKAPWPPFDPIRSEGETMRLSLIRAIDTLSDRERSAVLEVHVQGRTYEDAAQTTGIPLGSLKRALRSGLARLREVLEDDSEDGEDGEAG